MRKGKNAARFSVSADPALLRQFDRMRREKGYENRSLALADLMRDRLAEHHQTLGDGEAAGTVTLVYDHHKAHVQEALTELQHKFLGAIVATLHVHLDHEHCLEVIVARGKASALRAIADRLIGAKGVKHGKLSLTSTGKELPA